MYDSKHISTFERLIVPSQAITALSRWCRSTLLHQSSSLTINFPLTDLSRCAILPRWVSLNYFKECLRQWSHLMLLLLPNPSLTAPSSSLLFSRITHLNRIQKHFNPLLDLYPFWSHLFNIRRNVYRRFKRAFNGSTNFSRKNKLTEGHYKLLSFSFRMTLHYCATCFSLRLEQSPSVMLPFKTPLPVHQLTLALTLTLNLQNHSCFPTLLNLQFIVLPRRALWDDPDRNQTTLQTSTLSSTNTRDGPLTTVQNLSSRNSKLEKLITDEIATCTSIVAGIHSQYFFIR